MDKINFKIINTKKIWEEYKGKKENVSLNDNGITLGRVNSYELTGEVIDDTYDIVDLDIAGCNVVYLINKTGILTYDKNSGVIKEIGCKPGILPVTFESPSGIGIDNDTIYIADSSQDSGKVIALARSNFQIRWIISDFEGKNLGKLTDLVMGTHGDIYVLESDSTVNRVLKISKKGIVARKIGSGELSKPTDIEVDKDEKIYVLDETLVRIYGSEGNPEETKQIPANILQNYSLKGLAVDPDRHIFVGISGEEDTSKTIYRLDENEQYTPLWSYRGSTRKLITDSAGNLYVINNKGNKISFLEYIEKIKEENGLYSGFYISKPIDSKNSNTRWHRVLLEGEFKKGTQIEVSYYVGNNENSVDYNEFNKCLSGTSSIQGEEERDFLFQEEVRGQYLWFKITLNGTENISPAVNSITIFFPRTSYLDYLPAVYQDDPISKDFLERFLSIFESIFYEIDFKIENLNRLFDALGAPPDFLPWLGSWLSIPQDQDFPERMKRLYIHKAISLYKKRGTREGLGEAIAFFIYTMKNPGKSFEEINEWYGSETPFIVERYLRHSDKCSLILSKESSQDFEAIYYPPQESYVEISPDCTKLNSESTKKPLVEVLFGTEPFCFCVFLKDTTLSENSIGTIRRIIEEQKPAHTCYSLKVLEPWLYLDMHTYLGINTVLTRQEFVLGKTVIGRDSSLADEERTGQLGFRSRTGVDTKLT